MCPSLAGISERSEGSLRRVQEACFGTFADAREIINNPICSYNRASRAFTLLAVSAARGNMLRRYYAADSLVVRVGVRIRKLRMEQKLSLRNLGKRTGVHPFHVMAIELGQLAANAKTLRSIAKGLGVAPLDLLNHGAENDDMGHLVELMRKQPDYIQKIKLRVKPLVEN